MKLIFLLLCQLRWLSCTLIYHEESSKIFGSGIINNKTSFGYSITFTPGDQRLIVGAPKGNDVGALFTCEVETLNCTQISTGVYAPKGFHIWLGASVTAGSDFFATCAPRYFDNKAGALGGIFSQCYKYKTETHSGLKRLRDEDITTGPIEYRMLTLGWSMDVDDNDNVIAGGPAMYRGRATMYKYSPLELAKYPPILITFQKVKINFGYSIIHRIIQGRREYVISSTYGEHGFGLVLILNDFNDEAVIINAIRGKQVGAMFGASLCAVTVNNEGQSVLLVGAPTYAHDHMYNTGAVFVYRANDTNIHREVLGASNNGQFGYSLANLGDLNGDNIDDIAISAPFEDAGHGVVYIYSGAHLLDRNKQAQYLQRIKRKNLYSFGFSLHALPDYDKNGCKELAIGAPQSDTTVLLQCFASIIVIVEELSDVKVNLNSAAGKASIKFTSCLSFEFPKLPKTINAVFNVEVNMLDLKIEESDDMKKINTITYRLLVKYEGIEGTNRTARYCKHLTVDTPIDELNEPTKHYKISATLLEDPRKKPSFSPHRVTTSDRSVLTRPGSAFIGECKQGTICKPELNMQVHLSISTDVPYVVGSTGEETVRISVKNYGDPAYKTCVTVNLYNITLHSTPKCCVLSPTEDNLICNPIRLLRNNTTWDIDDIKLDTKSIMSSSDGGKREFGVSVHLYNDCQAVPANAPIDKWFQKVPLQRDAESVTVIGVIKHGGVINITRNEIETVSKQIHHEYKIYNNGFTTWSNVRFELSLQKEFFLDGISTISGHGYECLPYEETDMDYIINCKIITLKKDHTLEVTLPIDILSKIYETLKEKQLNVTSHLKIFLEGTEKSGSVVSTLSFYEFKVEFWIYVVAVLFALAIIIIAAFILYKRGFLRRKKKEDLRELRRSVRRQSMRRSAMSQSKGHESTDLETLIEVSEDGITHTESPSTTKTEGNEELQKDNKPDNGTDKNCRKSAEFDNKDKKDQDANATGSDETIISNNINEKKNDTIDNVIIGGLRKNIGRR